MQAWNSSLHSRLRRVAVPRDARRHARHCATSRRSSSAPAAGRAAPTSTSTPWSTVPARALPAARRRCRPDHQRAVVPRQPAPPRSRARVRPPTGLPQDRAPGRTARRAGRGHLLRLSRRRRGRAASELGHHALAAGISRGARLAMGAARDSVLDGRGARSPPTTA